MLSFYPSERPNPKFQTSSIGIKRKDDLKDDPLQNGSLWFCSSKMSSMKTSEIFQKLLTSESGWVNSKFVSLSILPLQPTTHFLNHFWRHKGWWNQASAAVLWDLFVFSHMYVCVRFRTAVLPNVGFTVSHFNDAHPSTQSTVVHSSIQPGNRWETKKNEDQMFRCAVQGSKAEKPWVMPLLFIFTWSNLIVIIKCIYTVACYLVSKCSEHFFFCKWHHPVWEQVLPPRIRIRIIDFYSFEIRCPIKASHCHQLSIYNSQAHLQSHVLFIYGHRWKLSWL